MKVAIEAIQSYFPHAHRRDWARIIPSEPLCVHRTQHSGSQPRAQLVSPSVTVSLPRQETFKIIPAQQYYMTSMNWDLGEFLILYFLNENVQSTLFI